MQMWLLDLLSAGINRETVQDQCMHSFPVFAYNKIYRMQSKQLLRCV